MHCVNCGASAPEGASFCPNCGKSPTVVAPPTGASAPAQGRVEVTPPKKRSKLLGCLAIGLGLFVLLAIIGSLADPKKQGSTTNTATESTANGTMSAKGNAENQSQPVPTVEADLPLAVSATQLFNAYQGNEAS